MCKTSITPLKSVYAKMQEKNMFQDFADVRKFHGVS